MIGIRCRYLQLPAFSDSLHSYIYRFPRFFILSNSSHSCLQVSEQDFSNHYSSFQQGANTPHTSTSKPNPAVLRKLDPPMARTKRAPDPWYQELQRAEQRSRSLGRWSTVNSRSSPSIPVQPVSTTERIESPTSPIENGPTIFSSSPPASAKEGLANNQSPSMPIITSNPTPSLGVLGGAQILLLLPPESHEEPSLVQQARARIFEGLSLRMYSPERYQPRAYFMCLFAH